MNTPQIVLYRNCISVNCIRSPIFDDKCRWGSQEDGGSDIWFVDDDDDDDDDDDGALAQREKIEAMVDSIQWIEP